MTDLRTAAQQALEALKLIDESMPFPVAKHAQAALRAALAQQEQEQEQEPVVHYYAKHLAIAIWEKHYKDTAPDWTPLPDLMGVLTQIDNMAVGLAPPRREPEPRPEPLSAEKIRAEFLDINRHTLPGETAAEDWFEAGVRYAERQHEIV